MVNPIDSVLGSLRRAAKICNLNAKKSQEFHHAALALVKLKDSVENDSFHVTPEAEFQVDQRTHAIKKGVQLQRHLEQDLKIPHKRSLGAAVDVAVKNGAVTFQVGTVMRHIAHKANLGRHQKWSDSQNGVSSHPVQLPIDKEVATSRIQTDELLQKLDALLQETSELSQLKSVPTLKEKRNPFMELDEEPYREQDVLPVTLGITIHAAAGMISLPAAKWWQSAMLRQPSQHILNASAPEFFPRVTADDSSTCKDTKMTVDLAKSLPPYAISDACLILEPDDFADVDHTTSTFYSYPDNQEDDVSAAWAAGRAAAPLKAKYPSYGDSTWMDFYLEPPLLLSWTKGSTGKKRACVSGSSRVNIGDLDSDSESERQELRRLVPLDSSQLNTEQVGDLLEQQDAVRVKYAARRRESWALKVIEDEQRELYKLNRAESIGIPGCYSGAEQAKRSARLKLLRARYGQ